jgi:hypothetical protein
LFDGVFLHTRKELEMRVAFGKTMITPPEKLGGYIGRPMAGYTPIPTCDSKYDELFAYAVLIESIVNQNIKRYYLLISMDILQIPLSVTEYIKDKLKDHFPIYPNQVLIHATHTHKSFDMTGTFSKGGNMPGVLKGIIIGSGKRDDLYKVWITKQIVQLYRSLMKVLQPAKMAWKKITPEEPLTINRRRHELSAQPFGVISFKNFETNQLIGFIMNFGAHPTTLSHQNHQMSADYPGRAVFIVENDTQQIINAIFFTGPAGDIGPYYGAGNYHFLFRNKAGALRKSNLYAFTQHYGYLLGRLGLKMAMELPEAAYFEEIRIRSFVKTFWVPMKDYKQHRLNGKKIWVYLNNRIVHIIKRYILFPLALRMGDAHEPNFPGFAVKHNKKMGYWRSLINLYTKIQYITIDAYKKAEDHEPSNNLAIVGIPGELFEDYAKKIYAKTPAGPDNTFIFQAANDWIAYLFPLRDYIQDGGYEPLASFAPICGAYVIIEYLKLLQEIKYGVQLGYN